MTIGVHSISGSGPDGGAVAPGVVDERDAQRPPDLARQVARVGLAERVSPDPAQQVERPAQVLLAGERQPHDVLAALEVGRVRAGARVDDRVAVLRVEPRVVPAPAEVVALLVVGGGAEPGRLRGLVLELLEDDEALLPVRLVVVGAVERRAPVVHRVEEQVVEDDPALGPDDAAVVRDTRVALADRAIPPVGRGGGAAGDAPAQQERRHEPRVDEPRRQPDPGEATRAPRSAAGPAGCASGRARPRSSAAGRSAGTGGGRAAGRRSRRARRASGCRPGRRSSPRGSSGPTAGRRRRRSRPSASAGTARPG